METTEDEVALLRLLSDTASRTLDELVEVSGLSASQVLLAVDHLARSGHILLRKDGTDYYVTRNEAA